MYYKVVRKLASGLFASSQLSDFHTGYTVYTLNEFCGSGLEARGYGPLVFDDDLDFAQQFAKRYPDKHVQCVFRCHVRGIMPEVKPLVRFNYIRDLLNNHKVGLRNRLYAPLHTVMVSKVKLVELISEHEPLTDAIIS